jgi:oxygen-independent coproporphyrinogen-3 oxidase
MTLLSLYVHIPFCHRRCPYCSFYHEQPVGDRESDFVDAVAGEARQTLESMAGGVRLHTVYFGGGTPSVLEESSWKRIFDTLRPYLSSSDPTEITCELNPEDVTAGLLDLLAALGVNRVSLGVQTMDAKAQKVLGRCLPATNRRAIALVSERFSNVNFDILLGVPGRSAASLESTLDALTAHGPAHLSVYCLEPGGDMGEAVDHFFAGVDANHSADEYLRVCDRLRMAGYGHYEVSNFARPGYESLHNRAYWEGGEYVGLGPGAHSYLGGNRYHNPPSLDAYLANAGGTWEDGRVYDTPDPKAAAIERLMLGLRTSRGAALDSMDCPDDEINVMLKRGLAGLESGRLWLTDRGFLVLNEIVLRLIRYQRC